ncbi:unnamed protein product [Rotaria sp. Silwood2]|nr:unnamed protein product [Rotaria sp. Silwood2]CAF3431385.1 unnamed protein product [Rotaria sp. Silwood2]CAF4484950.1 unnamed protein product [Rotaria sp. Silwood2]CAF4681198.1 unnamed protein product [Rotaria sp. Silwood2]CAF4714899.1 unnamed protein product [Rotaria sp. Silwood2]
MDDKLLCFIQQQLKLLFLFSFSIFVQDTFFKQQDKIPLSKSSKPTNKIRTKIFKSTKSNINRYNSTLNIKDFNSFEYNNLFYQTDIKPTLNKSALIYQLIRSRLQANLARSISANKNRSINKSFIYSSSNL